MYLTFAVNRTVRVAAIPAVFALLSVCPVAGQIPDGPYFGQAPPGMTPEIFAPGIASRGDRREDKICFSPDGQQCALGVRWRIEYTRQEGGHWLPWDDTVFGTSGREPFFSADGTRFFFQWNWAIYVSEYDLGQWSTPVALPSPVNLPIPGEGQWVPLTTLDGTLYFPSNRDGTGGTAPSDLAIYRAPLVDGAYPVVEKLGPEINGPHGAADPFVAPDKSYMIFGSNRPEGIGDMDFYMTFALPDGSWTTPKNLGPTINTEGIEFAPYVSYDGQYFFFSRPEGFSTPDDPSDILWVDSAALFGPQACCSPGNSSCQTGLDPRSCAEAGGTPGGKGTACLGDGNGDGFDDICVIPCLPSAQPQPEMIGQDVSTKNRYLSFTAGGAGAIQAVRVTLTGLPAPYDTYDGLSMWVGTPVEVTENAGKIDPAEAPGFPTFWAAPLQCDPYYTDWSAFPVINVYNETIVPYGVYDLQVIDVSCQETTESSYSAPLTLIQSRWGDVVSDCATTPCGPPDGFVNVTSDVTAVLNKFKNLDGAPVKARSDLDMSLPDQKINISDVTLCLSAFGGFPYPFTPGPPPPPCP